VLVGSCKSSKGIVVAVVDANAIIQGGEGLLHSANRFVSVPEVIAEIRDPGSRFALNLLPFSVETIEPTPESLKKVISFAKATGDLQTLSDVDLKLIALTYMFETQFHGTRNLRENPPPIQAVYFKRLPEKDLPGWGSNVPNLEEWEALERAIDDGSNHNSKILPVKDLSSDIHSANQMPSEGLLSRDGSTSGDALDVDENPRKPTRGFPKKTEMKIEGKERVPGIDASKGQDEDVSDDWRPAVSRSTHRRFLRRKARREMMKASSEVDSQQEKHAVLESDGIDDVVCPEILMDETYEPRAIDCKSEDGDISVGLDALKLNHEGLASPDVPHENPESCSLQAMESANVEDLGNSEMSSQTLEIADDISSEQSWTLRSLSESSVACITTDFAMQNVILQMGLRLLAPGGMQIRELHRWVLKCHACFKVTTEVGRIFCPSCGNGGTLRKVAVTVGENGVVLASRRPRISMRGTKFSLPLPRGGRDAVAKNPILREDQLPQKLLYPKMKKKNNQEDEFFIPDNVFKNHTTKKSPHQHPVRKALAVFSGKRNPNDNHFAPPK
ncbi:hypothetical protein M569_05652, partial [Genlisea aurea]